MAGGRYNTSILSNNSYAMLPLQELKVIDPLNVKAEKTDQPEFSPMDPPEAYEPPETDTMPYEDMHPLLQKFMDEHRACEKRLDGFEEVLNLMRGKGPSREALDGLKDFYEFLDGQIVKHNLKEEKVLFPLLQPHLLESGAHSNGPFPKTVIDMLEDDHSQVMQAAAVSFSFFGMAARLPDADSRAVVFDAAIEQGKMLVELLRLHIFREDNVVFPLAHKNCSTEELDTALPVMEQYAAY